MASEREYLGVSSWSSARTAPVESGSVVEVLGASVVVVSEGSDCACWPENSEKCRNVKVFG